MLKHIHRCSFPVVFPTGREFSIRMTLTIDAKIVLVSEIQGHKT